MPVARIDGLLVWLAVYVAQPSWPTLCGVTFCPSTGMCLCGVSCTAQLLQLLQSFRTWPPGNPMQLAWRLRTYILLCRAGLLALFAQQAHLPTCRRPSVAVPGVQGSVAVPGVQGWSACVRRCLHLCWVVAGNGLHICAPIPPHVHAVRGIVPSCWGCISPSRSCYGPCSVSLSCCCHGLCTKYMCGRVHIMIDPSSSV
jgi:hypothetical protein